jgi:hypothetical protein
MLTRTLQIIGLSSLMGGIVLGAVAGALETRRPAEYYDVEEDGNGSEASSAEEAEARDRAAITTKLLATIAASLFLAGSVICWIAWRCHHPPAWVFRRSGARYSTAKLCHRTGHRSRRSNRRPRGPDDSTPSLPTVS